MSETGLIDHPDGCPRCWWAGLDPLYVAYHDTEWGVPEHDGRALYEKLILDGFQAGLSWITILRRREGFRDAFAGFEPERVAAFGEADVERLLADAGIVRNRAKIEAAIANAAVVADLGQEFADLVLAHRVVGRPRPRADEVPATSPESVALARALRGVGIRFVGPTTAYALMQAVGLVDDHLVDCEVPPLDPATGELAAVGEQVIGR